MSDHYLNLASKLADSNLEAYNVLRLKIISRSMSPILLPGDLVVVRPTLSDVIHRGDILVTRRGEDYLAHRLVSITSNGWITKGDRNSKADAVACFQDIIGKVFAYERDGRLVPLDKKYQQYMARLYGWLSWEEINLRSLVGTRIMRLTLRVIQLILW